MSSEDPRLLIDNTPPAVEPPDYRPLERFWPYRDLSEQPTDEELATLEPELAEALFGTPRRPFSMTLDFGEFPGPDFERAVALARQSAEYRELVVDGVRRHRARYLSRDAARLRDLFEVVGRYDGCDVLIDDRPLPLARELWLPLVFVLI